MTRIFKIIIYSVLGIIVFLLLNFFIIEKYIIPDPCFYHNHNTTKTFDLFYQMTADEGYHPTPTKFNLLSTLTIGTLIGLIFGLKITKEKK